MLFNGRALIFTFSGTQVRIAEIERRQSLFKMSMVSVNHTTHLECFDLIENKYDTSRQVSFFYDKK